MKAHLENMILEGSPEEIDLFIRLKDKNKNQVTSTVENKYVQSPKTVYDSSPTEGASITSK